MGGFATTFLSLSLAMMNFRGVFTQTIFMGDLCFVAGIGLLISAQWEMVRGNTFSYTVLSAYGLSRETFFFGMAWLIWYLIVKHYFMAVTE
jgi:succinate-acetate transporter protein